jgi:Sec-independent protein translocase protein TatA
MNPLRPTGLSSVIIIIIVITFILGASLPASAQSVDDKIENLQQQIDELRTLLKEERSARDEERQEFQAERAAQKKERQEFKQEVATIKSTASADRWPVASFGGQYRINFYSVDDDTATDNQTAGRARIRQNIDLKFFENFKTHLQLELSHTTDNLTTTPGSSRGNSVGVRHAVMDYTFERNGINMQAGLVPLGDYYHDTMFSSDWDYNPLAASFIIPLGGGNLRLFAANLGEATETSLEDDFVHYQADFSTTLSGGNKVTLSGTAINFLDDPSVAVPGDDSYHFNASAGINMGLGNGMTFNGLVMGSWTDKSMLGTTDDGEGVAILAELTGSVGSGNFGLMVTHASGESDSGGFLSPMAIAGTNGYWGYTGLMTVQGPTDTAFDGDSVNISNNGYGLTTLQGKYSFPIMADMTGYLAAGWFGNTDVSGRDDDIGFDLIGMTTYRFNKVFALDLGLAYADYNDSHSGYFQGVRTGGAGGATLNAAAGSDQDRFAAFGRLQAEF